MQPRRDLEPERRQTVSQVTKRGLDGFGGGRREKERKKSERDQNAERNRKKRKPLSLSTHQWCPSWSKPGLGAVAAALSPTLSKWCSKVEKQKAAWEGSASGPPPSSSSSSSSSRSRAGRLGSARSELLGIERERSEEIRLFCSGSLSALYVNEPSPTRERRASLCSRGERARAEGGSEREAERGKRESTDNDALDLSDRENE